MDRTRRVFKMLAEYERKKSPEELLKKADRCLGTGLIIFPDEVCEFFPGLNPDGTFAPQMNVNGNLSRLPKIW